MAFPDDIFEESLDPDERKTYRLKFKLNPTERVVISTSDMVDAESKAVDTDSKVTILRRSVDVISGVVWGATATVFMTSNDLAPCEIAWIRFRLEIDATPPLPETRKIDQTWGIRLKQR